MKKLSLRDVLIGVGALLGILVFVFSFFISVKSSGEQMGVKVVSTTKNVVWGSDSWERVVGSTKTSGKFSELFGGQKHGVLVLPLIGAILALVGGLGACLSLLLVKDAKVQKICLIVCGALLVVGGVLMFFVLSAMALEESKRTGASLDDIKKAADAAKEAGIKTSAPLGTVAGILGIAGGLSVCAGAVLKK